jgi:signal transduction histidine kinase
MRARVAQAGGRLTLSSRSGEGTLVRVAAPLTAARGTEDGDTVIV